MEEKCIFIKWLSWIIKVFSSGSQVFLLKDYFKFATSVLLSWLYFTLLGSLQHSTSLFVCSPRNDREFHWKLEPVALHLSFAAKGCKLKATRCGMNWRNVALDTRKNLKCNPIWFITSWKLFFHHSQMCCSWLWCMVTMVIFN